jgi:hypothetical protein
MADFDLTQTDAQVQSILNDGQNMQGAGAQTTLTTESVLLKDVNGNYHKILKSSFTEAIRDTLAGLLVNNDKGTTINQIAAIASGDFGSITPANLASVLGALFHMFYYTYEMQNGGQQTVNNTYLGAVIFFTSRSSAKTYVMQIPYYTIFEETYGEFKVKRTSNGSSAVIENMSGSTTTVKLIVFGMDF